MRLVKSGDLCIQLELLGASHPAVPVLTSSQGIFLPPIRKRGRRTCNSGCLGEDIMALIVEVAFT